jgi:hypothetical protein
LRGVTIIPGCTVDQLADVFAEVDDNGCAHSLPCQRTARTTRQDGDFASSRDLDCSLNIFFAFGNHHANGLDLIEAGVGAIQHARKAIKADFSLHHASQFIRYVAAFLDNMLHLGRCKIAAGRNDSHMGPFQAKQQYALL